MNPLIRYIVAFFLYLIFQVGLFDQMSILGTARPFVFLLFLFLLPFSTPVWLVYVISFLTGFSVEIFSESTATGIHAFSALLAMGFRGRIAGIAGASQMRLDNEINFSDQSHALVCFLPAAADFYTSSCLLLSGGHEL